MRKRAIVPIVLLAALMLRSRAATEAAAQAVRSCATVVFPTLFPFSVVTRRLTRSGALQFRRGERLSQRLFGVPASGLGVFAVGSCGGYPLGVSAACELVQSGQLQKAAAERLLAFCNNTGPAIFFGMVGALLFESPLPCAVLYGIHILSALMTGILFSRPARASGGGAAARGAIERFSDSLRASFLSVAQLCGYVVFFAVITRLILDFPVISWMISHGPLPEEVARAALCALLDLPGGLSAAAAIGNPALRFVLCSAGISWGGLCVHIQARGLWQEAGLHPRGYFAGKALQTGIALALSIPAAGLLFGQKLPLWSAVLPILAVLFKIIIAFSAPLRYNEKNRATEGLLCCFVRSKNPAPTVSMRSR